MGVYSGHYCILKYTCRVITCSLHRVQRSTGRCGWLRWCVCAPQVAPEQRRLVQDEKWVPLFRICRAMLEQMVRARGGARGRGWVDGADGEDGKRARGRGWVDGADG